jgi:GNAT superfamily N-acetyltransferase
MVTRAIEELQVDYLDATQVAASHAIMGLDTQLIDDGTYFVVEGDGALAGCGGWSRRATLYGGDRSPGRNAALLDPAKDAARVRAMYTHPAFTRRGVGRLILARAEEAAAAADLALTAAGALAAVRSAALQLSQAEEARAQAQALVEALRAVERGERERYAEASLGSGDVARTAGEVAAETWHAPPAR